MLIALLPVAGSIGGSLVAELWALPRWMIGAALHMAMGVAIGIVSVEFVPRALDTTPAWVVALLFSIGAAVSVFLSRAVRWLSADKGDGNEGKWQVYSTTSVDLFSDGLMTGASFAVSSGLGLLLAITQVVGNLPGGIATGANFRQRGVSRAGRLWAAFFYLIPALVSAALGYLLLRDAGTFEKNASLAIIAGLLLVTTVEEMVPEADRPGTRRWISTLAFVLGFVFIAMLGGKPG